MLDFDEFQDIILTTNTLPTKQERQTERDIL